MAFLDSLDLDFADKKSDRIRSWYLFEQYKSLEKNQLYAAQRLRDRSYQDRILFQELSERKARRTPYKVGSLENIRKLHRNGSIVDTRTPITLSTEHFFESFSDFHEDIDIGDIIFNPLGEGEEVDNWLEMEKQEEVAQKFKEKDHDVESINSIDENIEHNNNTLNKESESMNDVPGHVDFDTELFDEYKSQGEDELSVISSESYQDIKDDNKKITNDENVIFTVWTKFVSFAYQIILLNRGNCYCESSSHILTAVLMCDIIFRSTGKICNILQPYTSPIKFASSDDEVVVQNCQSNQQTKRNKANRESSKNNKFDKEFQSIRIYNKERNWQSENICNPKCICHKMVETLRRSSESRHCVASTEFKEMFDSSSSTSSSGDSLDICTEELCNECVYRKVKNPMIKLIKYMDHQLKTCQQIAKRM